MELIFDTSQKNERRNLFTAFEKDLFLLHTVRFGGTTRTDPRGAELLLTIN